MQGQRIISLLPSATEIVVALGLQDRLVGRSHECDFPPEVQHLPICSQPKYRADGTSPEISQEVQTILREALSIYRVDVEAIRALRPTHIITQSQCAVCAVSTTELKEALHEYLHRGPVEVIDLQTESWGQVLENMCCVADALDAHPQGERLAQHMKTSLEEIRARAGSRPDKPRIAHIEWVEPLMVAGHWMMELIAAAGGANAFPDEDKRWIGFDELAERDPDKIVIAPCGFSIQRTLEDVHYLEERPAWQGMAAPRNHQVYVCDGNHYFNRPGPRLIDSLEILAEIFQPDLFPPKHEQSGWIRLTADQTVR